MIIVRSPSLHGSCSCIRIPDRSRPHQAPINDQIVSGSAFPIPRADTGETFVVSLADFIFSNKTLIKQPFISICDYGPDRIAIRSSRTIFCCQLVTTDVCAASSIQLDGASDRQITFFERPILKRAHDPRSFDNAVLIG